MSTQDKMHYYEEYAMALALAGRECVLHFSVSNNIEAIWICSQDNMQLR